MMYVGWDCMMEGEEERLGACDGWSRMVMDLVVLSVEKGSGSW